MSYPHNEIIFSNKEETIFLKIFYLTVVLVKKIASVSLAGREIPDSYFYGCLTKNTLLKRNYHVNYSKEPRTLFSGMIKAVQRLNIDHCQIFRF